MADVFLSYARADRAIAKQIVDHLEAAGYSVFWDIELRPGERFHHKIRDMLNAVRCVVVLWTEHSVDSDWVVYEAEKGRARRILVPLALGDVDIPPPFPVVHTTRVEEFDERTMSAVLHSVRGLAGERAVTRPVSQPPSVEMSSRDLWATDEGTDEFGRWADVRLADVTFRMRWIPPGIFTMSPGMREH